MQSTDLTPRYEPEPEDEDAMTISMTSQEISGAGRDALVERINRLQTDQVASKVERDLLYEELFAAKREVKALTDNVTSLQSQSNAALVAQRLNLALTDDHALCAAVLDVVWAVGRARKIHSEGCSILAVMQEAGEAAKALEREDANRYRSELVDTAAVVVRLLAGDIDHRLQPREPYAARAR